MAYNSISASLLRCATLICALTIAGCGGGGSAPAAPTAVDQGTTDLDIAKLAYSADYRVPAGFYQEPRLYPERSEFRFHVKSSDVVAASSAVDYELCNDDFAVALQWSADSADARQFDTTFSASSDTEWFFEFERLVSDEAASVLINRVFKCAMFDRSGVDANGIAGQINKPSFSADDLRFVSEYLWQFSIYNNALHAVISSDARDVPGGLAHDLTRAEVRIGEASVNGCDLVELWRWRYVADTTNGELQSEQQFIRSFNARQVNGVVTLCE